MKLIIRAVQRLRAMLSKKKKKLRDDPYHNDEFYFFKKTKEVGRESTSNRRKS